MKKLFLCSLAAMSLLGTQAADLVIYQDGVLNSGLVYNPWWGAGYDPAAANPAGGAEKVFSFKTSAADNPQATAGGCMGFQNQNTQWALGKLNTATLTFDWYANAVGTYQIRLTAEGGPEQDYALVVTDADLNKWKTTSLSIPDTYPAVAAAWKEFKGEGKGFPFAFVQQGTAEGAMIYFNNIIYSNIDESWVAPEIEKLPAPTTVPTPTVPAADVYSLLSAAYTPAWTFHIGSWGQTTTVQELTIDGAPVEYLKKFNYLGWELNLAENENVDLSAYDTMHVDYWTPNGTSFGFTPISRSGEKGWVAPAVEKEAWNSYDVPFSYFGLDFSKIFQVKFDNGGDAEGYIANVYFYKNDEQTPVDPPVVAGATYNGTVSGTISQEMPPGEPKEYPYTINYSIVYNEDKTLTITANYAWENGEPVGAVAGSVYVNNVNNEFALTDGTRVATTTDTFEAGAPVAIRFYIPVALTAVETAVNDYKAGDANDNVAVEAIDADNAPVEYYNLQGVRVANPENGLYIRVQGKKATKVIL